MKTQVKIALVGAIAALSVALITGIFSLYAASGVTQKTECGSTVNNTNGNVIVTGSNSCQRSNP